MDSKRVFDLIFSVLFLLLFSPFLVVIGGLVWLDSPGPIICKQIRIGQHKKPFVIFKFRTIKQSCSGVERSIIKNDECLTAFGKKLRPMHLDELPQLLNVLKGEMSLVGPRPLPMFQVAKVEAKFPVFHDRARVKPGMTGPVQIRGRKEYAIDGGLSAVALDVKYSISHTLWQDIAILAKTFSVVFKRQGV